MSKLRMIMILAGAALLATVSVAFASAQFTQNSKITLTATKAGATSGFKADISSADPGAPNGQPQALRKLTIVFPKKTKVNFKSTAIARCTASDIEIKATGGSACPTKSRIGTGSANVNGAPIFPSIPENAVAYAGSKDIIVLISPKGPAGQTLVLHGKVSANKVSVEVPQLAAGGLNFVLTELVLSIGKKGRTGKNAFVTAGKCVKHKFTVRSDFLYWTGESLSRTSSSKCKP